MSSACCRSVGVRQHAEAEWVSQDLLPGVIDRWLAQGAAVASGGAGGQDDEAVVLQVGLGGGVGADPAGGAEVGLEVGRGGGGSARPAQAGTSRSRTRSPPRQPHECPPGRFGQWLTGPGSSTAWPPDLL